MIDVILQSFIKYLKILIVQSSFKTWKVINHASIKHEIK